MKKIVIPTILAATILVAGMFAMMPVEKASTVHSSIASSPLALTATIQPATAAADVATWTIGQPFCVVSVSNAAATDANANLDLAIWAVSTNLVPVGDTGLAVNLGAGAASDAAHDILNQEAAGVISTPICGTTTLSVGNTAAAGDATIDTMVVTVLVQTRGTVAAPAAVLS